MQVSKSSTFFVNTGHCTCYFLTLECLFTSFFGLMNFYTSPNSLTETWLPAPSSEAELISLPFPLVHHVGCSTVSHARVFLASLLWAPQGRELWGFCISCLRQFKPRPTSHPPMSSPLSCTLRPTPDIIASSPPLICSSPSGLWPPAHLESLLLCGYHFQYHSL